jgi:hypothetical protein
MNRGEHLFEYRDRPSESSSSDAAIYEQTSLFPLKTQIGTVRLNRASGRYWEDAMTRNAFRLLVILLLAVGGVISVPSAAQAAEAGARTVLISRFDNGDVAYVKVAVEYETTGTPRRGRLHVKIFCNNSDGNPVQCGVIDMDGSAKLDYWREGYGWDTLENVFADEIPNFPRVDVHSVDIWSDWNCYGHLHDQYRTVAWNVIVTARSGQQGTWHTVPSNTANVYIC